MQVLDDMFGIALWSEMYIVVLIEGITFSTSWSVAPLSHGMIKSSSHFKKHIYP